MDIKAKSEKKILEVCPNCPNTSGIYFLIREEGGFKYAYVGQAFRILDRLAGHLNGYQRIDLSLKKHGFWSEKNQTGYKVHYLEFPKNVLDEKEQYYIRKYANAGYQMRNATAGGQGDGKTGLDNQRPSRGYYDGIAQGEKRCKNYVKNMFDKYLAFDTKQKPPNKLQDRKKKEFMEWLEDKNNE